jgi:hypothetical protein
MAPKNGFYARMWDLQQVHQEAGFNFIQTELDLAFTFINIGQTTKDYERATRNLAHAKRAYESATRFLENAQLSAAKRQVISEKIERLEELLAVSRPAAASLDF